MRRITVSSFLLFLMLWSASQASAGWVWSPESGKFVSSEGAYQDQAQEILQLGLSLRKEKNVDRALQEFENLVRVYSTSNVAPEAQYQIGLIYEELSDYSRAFDAYQKLTDNYPQSERFEQVIERLFTIGQFFMTGQKTKVAGLPLISQLPKSAEVFEHIVKKAPYGAYGDKAQFHAGMAYTKMGRYLDAIDAFQKVLDHYSTSPLASDAQFQLANVTYQLSLRANRDQESLDRASRAITDFIVKYPESNVAEKAKQLKKDIEERDAGKNFEVAEYYEKEGQFTSAELYYQDVAKRYPETQFGKRAAEKLTAIKAPVESMRSNQEVIEQELALIETKLKALDQEQAALRKKLADRQIRSEKEQLKETRELLHSKQGELTRIILERENALKRDTKTWLAKNKTFVLKKKEMSSNPAPELQRAFDRWKASLDEEWNRLNAERATVAKLKEEFGMTRERFSVWPFKREPREETQKIVMPLTQVREERSYIEANIKKLDEQLEQIEKEKREVEQKHFYLLKNDPAFLQFIESKSPELLSGRKQLESVRKDIDKKNDEFNQSKEAYAQSYGLEFLKSLPKAESVADLQGEPDEALTELQRASAAFADLQAQKARLADAWLKQKEIVESLSRAFELSVSNKTKELERLENQAKPKTSKVQAVITPEQKQLMEEDSTLLDAEKVLKDRALRKRIKFLERQVRKRFSEIEDWNQKRAKNLKKLDRLVNPPNRFSMITKPVHAITFPVRFTYWLSRSLAFGLSDDEKKLMKKADRLQKRSLGGRGDEIHKLHQDIAFQSVYIQARALELEDLKRRLHALKRKTEQMDMRAIVPQFFDRESAMADETIRKARSIIPEEDAQSVMIQRMDVETRKLSDLESQLGVLDKQMISSQKIEEISEEANDQNNETSEVDTSSENQQSAESDSSDERKQKWENNLASLHREILVREKDYRTAKQKLELAMFDFYNKSRSDVMEISKDKEVQALQERLKSLLLDSADLVKKRESYAKSRADLMISDRKALYSRRQKLEKSIAKTKGKQGSETKYTELEAELEQVNQQITEIETSLNQPGRVSQ